MIELRRAQVSFGDGLISAEVEDLSEDWMAHADVVLADEQLMTTVYEALAKRRPKSRSRGRRATPAEVVLRLLVLKHIRNWSYQALEREVRANLVYRDFTRVGGGKMPDAKTMGRWGTALGPQVIAQIHERMVAIAKDKGVAEGRKMRVDTTVVETNIHYPTDSSLLGDGVRVLTRAMKKITAIAGAVGTKLRDRSRSEGKIVSVFEPSTEIIRKGKTSKPTEFGKMVKLQEAENQIVTAYEVYDQRPADSDLLIDAIDTHQARLGRTPRLVAADAAFYSDRNERAAKEQGVKRVCIPNRSTKSAARKHEQKKRWFRQGQKWRTGCEGRISVTKRRHGLNRCRYKGDDGMKRWVGLGVIADNLINIGRALDQQAAPAPP